MTKELNELKAQREFLISCWQQLATLAWQGYKGGGRGALVITQAGIKTSAVTSKLNRLTGEVRYITEATTPGNELPPTLKNMVTEYNPRQSIVVLFVTTNTDFDHHHIPTPEAEPTPQIANANVINKGNWLLN